ncbi:type IV secretory system conjugative DNA transfer family protein [Desulfofundulus sp. TPOSR]|nr:type IV secretory system conjugative DNA transfer family protein [Desulfofundulus sp. TPOSR]
MGGRFRGGTGWGGIRMKPGDATHGSARWAVKADLARVCDFGFGPGIILGAFGSRPVRIPVKPKTWMNKHVLVVGAPGSGKSRGYVRPNIFAAVRAGESVIVTDPKGELYRDMAAWLRTKGYAVRVLNLVRMEESDRWNPLTGNTDTPGRRCVRPGGDCNHRCRSQKGWRLVLGPCGAESVEGPRALRGAGASGRREAHGFPVRHPGLRRPRKGGCHVRKAAGEPPRQRTLQRLRHGRPERKGRRGYRAGH